ncbi:MAG: hypothetical protein Q9217_002899 [Psora testacea]
MTHNKIKSDLVVRMMVQTCHPPTLSIINPATPHAKGTAPVDCNDDFRLVSSLLAKNPQLNASASRPGQNTKSGSKANPWDQPKKIVRWQDFEYDALQSIYSGKLRQILDHTFDLDDITIPEIPFCQIHDEDSLESLIIKWNQSITSTALSAAQGYLGTRHTEKIYMCKGGQANWPGETRARRRPDWAAVKYSTIDGKSKNRAKNILPGDTKLSSKWSSITINPGDIEDFDLKQNWYQPMAQIFTYCVRNDARHGYLITDKELVVVRVGPKSRNDDFDSQRSLNDLDSILIERPKTTKATSNEAEDLKPYLRALDEGYLEYRAIPWQHYTNDAQRDSAVMTVNLALWWLHMMAANDSSIKEEYTPLKDSEWGTSTDAETQSSSFALSEGSLDRPPFAEKSPKHSLNALSLHSDRAGNKRSRKNEEEDAAYVEQESPQKRKTRGRK